MSRAFTGVPAQSWPIGSVKTNVGHLDRAAGVTGLIKTASALENATLPATLHYQRANPQIPLDDSPFRVQTERGDWPRGEHPRRAGVSAFGIGGTNAHVVLEEAPPCRLDPARPRPRLLLFSARTEPAVQQRVLDFGSRLAGNSDDELADMAYTLQVGRAEFEHRRAAVVTDRSDALSVLCTNESGRLLGSGSVVGGRGVGVVFAGVGEQYVGWTAGLYESEPVFRAVVDECAVVVESLVGVDLRRVLFGGELGSGGVGVDLRSMVGRGVGSSVGGVSGLLASTVVAQPAVFVVEYALARLLESWGVRADVLAGYSVGEYVAATVAGVMSWRDALSLVAFRARLIDRCPVGAMTAVSLPVARLRPLLGSGVDVAAVNAPGLCVMSGPVADVAEVERGLAAAQVAFRRLDTGHAFHSRMLLPVAQELTDWIRVNVRLAAPKIPYLSNVTGSWVRDDQALDPGYWAEHMCGPVRFADAAAELLADPDRVIVEIGPGQTLGAFIRQQPSCGASRMGLIIPTLPGQHEHVDSAETLHTAVARLWLAGVGIDWAGYHAGEARRRVPLPTYPFQRQRYWIDPPTAKSSVINVPAAARPELSEARSVESWFQVAQWSADPATADACAAPRSVPVVHP